MEMLTPCPYEDFRGSTQKALLLHDFYLQEQLDRCNLKLDKLSQWYKDLKAKIEDETR